MTQHSIVEYLCDMLGRDLTADEIAGIIHNIGLQMIFREIMKEQLDQGEVLIH